LDASTREAGVTERPVDALAPSAPARASDAAAPDDLVRERDALRARVAALEAELAPIRAASEARRPTFTFGKSGREDFVLEADWPELARAHRSMTAALSEVMAAKARGEAPAKETLISLQEHTERLRRYEFAA